jgi:hypothetical protein
MALVDMWEVRVRQSYPGAGDIMNVFHMRALTPPGDAEDVCDKCIQFYIPVAKAMQSLQLHYVDVVAMNLRDRFKVATVDASTHVGQMGGEYLPHFMAYSFITQRESNDVRHGYKRLAGVSEEAIVNGQPTALFRSLLTDMENELKGTWGGTFEWHIIKRIKYTPTGKTIPRWRLPQNDSELVSYKVLSAPYHGITTQNTRKR